MKQILLLTSLSMLTLSAAAQTQLGNGDMELWETVSSGSEPTNWNSFMTAQGSFSAFGGVQIEESSNTRPGSTGTKSARVWSRDAGFGVTANGNMTLGKINMGSVQASSSSNYNFSEITNPDHSEAITDSPDSIVFWVRYTPTDLMAGEQARIKATLHDDYEYRDPEDATAADHVVATAEMNYSHTSGEWVRMAVAFDYSGPASVVEYILVTFATNAVPGGGEPNDEILIDDIELVYNTSGVEEEDAFPMHVFLNNDNSELNFVADEWMEGDFQVFNMTGASVLSGTVAPTVGFEAPAGIYVVQVRVGNKAKRFKVYHK